jgi:putative ABC transport system permease protein
MTAVVLVSVADLRWRARRFLVGVAVTALLLALSLLLAGVSAFFHNEVRRTVTATHADGWVVPAGDTGPFMSSDTVQESLAARIKSLPNVEQAEPVAIVRATLRAHRVWDVDVIGVRPVQFVSPPVVAGRPPAGPGEITVNRSLHIALGSEVELDNRRFHVVGLTSGLSYRANTPSCYLTLGDVQALAYGGQPLASTVAVIGVPPSLPPGLTLLTDAQVRADMLVPIRNPIKLIQNVELLLWIVAAMVIASIIYLSALDRTRDFAVLKATGSTTGALFAGLVLQAALLAVLAYAIAAALAALLSNRMPMPSEIPSSAYLLLAGVSAVVVIVASLSGLRRSARTDPAAAFAGAA